MSHAEAGRFRTVTSKEQLEVNDALPRGLVKEYRAEEQGRSDL